MGATPDRHPGPIDEDEHIILEPQSVHPVSNGQFCYVTGQGFRFFEEGVERGLGSGGELDLNRAVMDTGGALVYVGDGDIVLKT
jgi:hypothetical protein